MSMKPNLSPEKYYQNKKRTISLIEGGKSTSEKKRGGKWVTKRDGAAVDGLLKSVAAALR